MKKYIFAQAIFVIMLCMPLLLQRFVVENKIVDKVLSVLVLLIFLVMVFVQSYLKSLLELRNITETIITTISLAIVVLVDWLAKVIKDYISG